MNNVGSQGYGLPTLTGMRVLSRHPVFVDRFNSLVNSPLNIWQPEYTTYRTIVMEGHTDEPPAYSPTPRRHRIGAGRFRHEHRYVLEDKSGRNWVSFKVKSRAADPKNTPLFFEGDTIAGEVQLDLAKAKTLKGLTITVRPHAGLFISLSIPSH
jgi:hypothetical protein